MPRSYTVAVAALALDVPYKWLDNLLSHHDVNEVPRGRRGLERRVTPDALVLLAAARTLNRELGIGIGRALALARSAGLDGANGSGSGRAIAFDGDIVRLELDLDALRRHVDRALLEAVEFSAMRRRGRPPASTR